MEAVLTEEETENTKLHISDPVVYKLARVVGDGIYVAATDDEVMKVEDLIDQKSSLQFVPDDAQTAVCTSHDDAFCQEFMAIDCEDLLNFDDLPTQGGRSDAVADTKVDLGKLNPQFEKDTQAEPTPVDGKNEQSVDRKQVDSLIGSTESEPSTSTMCADSKPDFSKLEGEICLENLSVRELQATFKATFGRETNVKDKQWLKRRISMGLSNSCDVLTTTFIFENNRVKKKVKVKECNDKDENHNEVSFPGFEGKNVSGDSISVGQTIQMEDYFSANSNSVQSATSKHHNVSEDDNQGSKRVRKPTRRYIEEVSESDSREHSGKPVSSFKSSIHGTRTRVRPVYSNQPVRRPLVTRQDSLGGSGVEIPYVCRIRRGRPRENFMALMKFQSCGMGVTAKLISKAHDEKAPRSDNDIENHGLRASLANGWAQEPPIKESEESEQCSEQSCDYNNDSDEGPVDSYAEDSDGSIPTVPTAKGGMRRKHHRPWTLNEVVKLVDGVSRYGAGRWSEIKKISFATCSHRTSVDLKDKWRNLLKASFVQLPAEKRGANLRNIHQFQSQHQF